MKRIELKITGQREVHQSSDGNLSFHIRMQMGRRNVSGHSATLFRD